MYHCYGEGGRLTQISFNHLSGIFIVFNYKECDMSMFWSYRLQLKTFPLKETETQKTWEAHET